MLTGPSCACTAGDHFIILHVIPTGQAASEFFTPNSPQNHASILVRVAPAERSRAGPSPLSKHVQLASWLLSRRISSHVLCSSHRVLTPVRFADMTGAITDHCHLLGRKTRRDTSSSSGSRA